MKRMLSLLLLAGLSLSTHASADPAGIKATITGQMNALKLGDAVTAYSFAAPQIKRLFPTPERFIMMVRKGYEPVTHARAPRFLRRRAMEDGSVAQEVAFSDDAGQPWRALYTLEEQSDGRWCITGVYLRKIDGTDA